MPATMRQYPRHRAPNGFSLVELSMVVAILSVVAALGLETAANFINRTSGVVTKEKLVVVDKAIADFFKIYGRLPCPAARATAPSVNTYGTEDCSIAVLTATTIGGGLVAGGVPYRALNIPASFAVDGFGSKITYVVTKNLTAAGVGTSQFGHATDGYAGIEVRTGVQEQPCSTSKCQVVANASAVPSQGAAYMLISHGADQRGAVSARGVTLSDCASSAGTDRRVDAQNCVFGNNAVRANMSITTIPYNVFYDNRYNAGLNLNNYFDDYVIWRAKAQL